MKRTALALWLAVGFASGCTPPDPIAIERAYVNPPVPGRDVAVGYFEITNNTGADLELAAAESSEVRAIEIHAHVQDGDMMRMRRLSSVVIAPRTTLRFAPGGHHLMLFGYAGGDTGVVPLTLHFSNGEARSVQFAVQPRGEH